MSLDGQALARAVDSLLNYETVKYFGAESRERGLWPRRPCLCRGGGEEREFTRPAQHYAGADHEPADGRRHGLHRVGVEPGRADHRRSRAGLTYLMQLFRPLDMLGWVYRTIRQGIIDMAAMFRLIDSEVEDEDVPGAPALVVNRPTVAFENVVFGYEKDRTILHGLSFEVPAGSHVAIVGPSGAGKSTIGRLLFRFYDPQSGRILIDGQDIAQVTQASLRENIGIVPQDSVLFNDSIGYNIAYGRREAEHDDIVGAARSAAICPSSSDCPTASTPRSASAGLSCRAAKSSASP